MIAWLSALLFPLPVGVERALQDVAREVLIARRPCALCGAPMRGRRGALCRECAELFELAGVPT
jgi:hypothetical protein